MTTQLKDLIRLFDVIYDVRARNGVWCTHPYEGHPKGCPNFPKCPQKYPDFESLRTKYLWYAVVEMFDLEMHARLMREKYPKWSERQCKNPLYWQGSVRTRLKEKAYEAARAIPGSIVLEIPEACGVNVFETMLKEYVLLERTPRLVKKVMLVGIPVGPVGGTQ
jgi:hypothetical protein